MPSNTEDIVGTLAGSTNLKLTTYAATIWGSANYAKDWFDDACAQASAGLGADYRRREILFSVCFLESYLFEWVRSIDIGSIEKYFPTDSNNPKYFRKLKKKWKEIPEELFVDGLISAKPALDLSSFGQLIRARNGLSHAEASRPYHSDVPESKLPYPERTELEKMKPGWAVEISVNLVRELHVGSGTKAPGYLNWSASESQQFAALATYLKCSEMTAIGRQRLLIFRASSDMSGCFTPIAAVGVAEG